MGYWRDSEWLKGQGTENVSEAARGNLWAEGCLTGEVAFSPGTQPTHGDLTGREHRKKKNFWSFSNLQIVACASIG